MSCAQAFSGVLPHQRRLLIFRTESGDENRHFFRGIFNGVVHKKSLQIEEAMNHDRQQKISSENGEQAKHQASDRRSHDTCRSLVEMTESKNERAKQPRESEA